mgnify:CR=1 FL=1
MAFFLDDLCVAFGDVWFGQDDVVIFDTTNGEFGLLDGELLGLTIFFLDCDDIHLVLLHRVGDRRCHMSDGGRQCKESACAVW